MPVDIIFLAFNRLEFTQESMQAMIANTDWTQVRRLVIYDDGSTDGTREYLKSAEYPIAPEFVFKNFGGPVAITNDYLSHNPSDIFAKIDNDTMLPSHWLTECLNVMAANKKLDLLGIEAFYPVKDGQVARGSAPARHIGGIGLMRRSCFKTAPKANGRSGFTSWQHGNPWVTKGWLNPSLPVFLMDRIHFEPWASLSRKYVANGWQRVRAFYDDSQRSLWEWWKP